MRIAPRSHDLLVHVRTVIGIILGLGVARPLNGVAGLAYLVSYIARHYSGAQKATIAKTHPWIAPQTRYSPSGIGGLSCN